MGRKVMIQLSLFSLLMSYSIRLHTTEKGKDVKIDSILWEEKGAIKKASKEGPILLCLEHMLGYHEPTRPLLECLTRVFSKQCK